MKTLYSFCLGYLFFFFSTSYAQETKITIGDNWKYYDQGDVATTTWKDIAYNDTAWPTGNAELGYGDGDENTVISFGPNASNKHITSYFRKTFNLDEASTLSCQVKVDDGCAVYLNGVEVFRNGLPTGTISFSTLANSGGNENTWHSFTIPSNLTTIGTNTVAVEMHQNSASSSDLSFDFEAKTVPPPPVPGLYINELMASNDNTAFDQNGVDNDWIEIYNAYSYAVDLNGYYLSDDKDELNKSQITSSIIIPAGGRKIFWASGDVAFGDNHVDFRLSAGGEFVALCDNSLNILDSLSFDRQRTDVSFGRMVDGSPNLRYFSPASYNAPNVATQSYLGILPPPSFSVAGGFKSSPFNLSLNTDTEGASIYYTSDGSIPNSTNTSGTTYQYKNEYPGPFFNDSFQSFLYSTPIAVNDISSQPNRIANKSTSFKFPDYIPSSPIRKGTILSAVASKPGYLSSDVATETYFFFPTTDFSFPIVSVSTDQDFLFDYNDGIYTAGVDFENFSLGDVGVCTEGNYFRRGSLFENTATFEYFENGEKKLGFPIQLRLHGGCSRSNPYKSLRLYADDVFDYPIFDKFPGRKHKRLILRNSGNDATGTLFRDALYQDIVGSLNFGSQETKPSVVFLNGEYWGIHNIRERFDKYYFEELFDVDPDNIDLLEPKFTPEIAEGDLVSFNNLKSFLDNNTMSNTANYNQLKNLIDVDNYADYQIAGMYCANFDWVTNNVRMWRARTPGGATLPEISPVDGRWRWVLFDVDHGLGGFYGFDYNSFELSTQPIPETMTFRRLLESPEFRIKFINRFSDLLNTMFLPNHCIAITEEWKQKYAPLMAEHIARWKSPQSISTWESEINEVKNFFVQRPAVQRNQISAYFGNYNIHNLTVDVSAEEFGFIKVNTIDIVSTTPGVEENPYPWTGLYYQDVPVTLNAIPQFGYKFTRWEKGGVTFSTNPTITINLVGNQSYKAIFEEDFVSLNPTPTAQIIDKCGYSFTSWSELATSGSFPPHMAFVYMDQADPEIDANIEDFTSGAYNLSSRTRISGLGENGIAFINTGNSDGNLGYPGTKLGGAILAINTLGYDSISLSFTAGTITANNREYNLRLQYRIGDLLPFQDLLDENNNPIEYVRNATEGHEQVFENIKLPSGILNKPYVQLLWRYYFTGTRNSNSGGARDEIRLDNIVLSPKKYLTGTIGGTSTVDSFGIIQSKEILENTASRFYQASKSITLLPGFKAPNTSIFKAEIDTCF